MKPISFHKAEQVFTLHGDDSVLPLPVLRVYFQPGMTGLVSAWKPSWKDMWNMLRGKPIFLVLHSPIQPPVSLSTEDLELKEL